MNVFASSMNNNNSNMVPSVENYKANHDHDTYYNTTTTMAINNNNALPKRNITFAVNYEVSMVNQFHRSDFASSVETKRAVETVPESTCATPASKPATTPKENSNTNNSSVAPGKEKEKVEEKKDDDVANDKDNSNNIMNITDKANNNNNKQVAIHESTSSSLAAAATPVRRNSGNSITTTRATTAMETTTTPNATTSETTTTTPNNNTTAMRRKSRREKKNRSESLPLSRARVRYDMQLVPPVARSKAFLRSFGSRTPWMVQPEKPLRSPHLPRASQPKPVTNMMEGVVDLVDDKPPAPANDASSTTSSSSMPPLAPEDAPAAGVASAGVSASGAAPSGADVTMSEPPTTTSNNNKQPKQQVMPRRRSSRLSSSTNSNNHASGCGSSDTKQPQPPSRCSHCGQVKEEDSQDQQLLSPFEDDTSVVWIPSKRSEWEDTVSEMTAVCTSAALRRYNNNLMLNNPSGRANRKPFYAPLSRDYIRDRVDIDDPLNGYQVRHRTGGWLQGFVMWTNFTTWTHHFEWDSNHPMSGIPNTTTSTTGNTSSNLTTTTAASTPNITNTTASPAHAAVVDSDGSLARELQSCSRSGDPHGGGIVFDGIAEIGLVGGLGCGEYLLRMAIESIMTCPKQNYKYIVLQATEQSKTFYEKYGFKRVGAICRYGVASPINKTKTVKAEKKAQKKASKKKGKNQQQQQQQQQTSSSVVVQGETTTTAGTAATAATSATTTSSTADASAAAAAADVQMQLANTSAGTGGTVTTAEQQMMNTTTTAAAEQPLPEQHHELPIVGYRHWTHANESETSLQMHGGPSYMMCLKLPERPVEVVDAAAAAAAAENNNEACEQQQEACCSECGCARNKKRATFLERMMSLAVDQKPTIEQLGSSFTPGPKARRSSSSGSTSAAVLDASYANEPHLLGHGKRKRHSSITGATRRNSYFSSAAKLQTQRSNSFDSWKSEATTSATSQTTAGTGTALPPAAKRRKLSDGSAVPTSITTAGPPVKRGRGRPPLNRNQPPSPPQFRTTTSGGGKLWLPQKQPVKRGRGRPPKYSVPTLPAKTSTTPAKRGRPPKRPPTVFALAATTTTSSSGARPSRRKSLPAPSTTTSSTAGRKTRTRSVDSKKSKSKKSAENQPRPFYSVRGPDGRFVTIPNPNAAAATTTTIPTKSKNDNSKSSRRNSRTSSAAAAAAAKPQKSSSSRRGSGSAALTTTVSSPPTVASTGGGTRADVGFGRSDGKPTKINRSQLMKQKVKSYPRSRVHYYNRIVKPKPYMKQKLQYFFVLHYDEDTGRIRIAPMVARGVLSGKREGKPRYQVVINDTDSNFLTVNSAQYDVVPATMVMKTPVVANEAWDIEG